MQNIFTVDLEDWYHGNFIDDPSYTSIVYEERLIDSTIKILSLLKKTNNLATFFVLGIDAEKFPELITRIANDGHEIASHCYEHKLVYNRTRESFDADLKKSKEIIESIIGDTIIGFRAPYWSVKEDIEWVWEVLLENGFKYDSSVFPFKTYLYGNSKAPRFKYQMNVNGNVLNEVPPTVLSLFNQRIPFLGGFYFRVTPFSLIKQGLTNINKKSQQPGVFYIHPWELDPDKPDNSTGLLNKFILNYNIGKTESKLSKLLHNFQFTSIKDFYQFNS